MLKLLRSQTKVIIWAVVATFVLWGGFSVGTSLQGEGRYAGEISGDKITYQEFNRFYKATQIFGGGAAEEARDPQILKQQAWQNIIYAKEAKRQGVKVSDDEVRSQVKAIFKAQGVDNLTSDFYKRWLRSALQLEPKEFEEIVRDMMKIKKLITNVYSAPIVEPTDEEILERFQLDNARLKLRAVTLNSEEQVTEFRNKHEADQTWETLTQAIKPENVRETDFLDPDAIATEFQIPPSRAKALYFIEKGNLSEPIAQSGTFTLLKVTDKKVPEKASLDKDTKEKLREELRNEKREMMMLEWNLELLQKAKFKDFTQRKDES